jgi:serine/threonine protein kinase
VAKERQQRIRKLFDAVLELDPSVQQQFLLAESGGDHELALAVWKLLAARNRSGGILDTPVVQRKQPAADPPSRTGLRIGPYKLLRELGHGGMGYVYLALRSDEVFQRVSALKLIRPEVAASGLVENFYAERQILARLDHPNISRIVDGGTTDDGLPYFVMDFVDGLTLPNYCAEHLLDVNQRLKLFRQVCSAAAYLHKNDVIHCDLKPSNILVDREGTAKLVDFGIARLSNSSAIEPTMPVMTAAYSSPEQLNRLRLTPASDIYSLGVILFELLTGRRPFLCKGKDLITAVTTTDPMPPSEVADPNEIRGATSTVLRGDLDAIVIKALQRDPRARYKSVQYLSADIENFILFKPVSVNQGTLPYRFMKLLRRNSQNAWVVSFMFILLGVIAWQGILIRERDIYSKQLEKMVESQQAVNRQHLAQMDGAHLMGTEPAMDLQALSDAYSKYFSEAIRVWPGMTPERNELINQTTAYLSEAQQKFGDNPEALRQLILAWLQLAEIEGKPGVPNLGDRDLARQSLQQASNNLPKLDPSTVQDLVSRLSSDLQSLGGQ